MQYLNIRKGKAQVRADGTAYAVPLFVQKTRKYGKVIDQTAVTRKKPILVTGAHDSGKTRWLTRMYEDAAAIWGAKIKSEPLWLSSTRPLAAWCDAPCVINWWEKCRREEEDAQAKDNQKSDNKKKDARVPWSKLKQWERSEVLPDYCRDTNAVLFIDDAHKLAGRKLEIARLCVMAAKIHVIAASEEQRIPPNLRAVLMRRDPQIFRLDSEVAYDATSLLMWAFIALSMGAGFWEVSVVLGGLKALGTGRRSSRDE